ncbi:hypothetical protein U1Q18_011498 [Sarracenia purpurea var. burkii]
MLTKVQRRHSLAKVEKAKQQHWGKKSVKRKNGGRGTDKQHTDRHTMCEKLGKKKEKEKFTGIRETGEEVEASFGSAIPCLAKTHHHRHRINIKPDNIDITQFSKKRYQVDSDTCSSQSGRDGEEKKTLRLSIQQPGAGKREKRLRRRRKKHFFCLTVQQPGAGERRDTPQIT